MVAKRDMYSKISKYGYCYLDELESDISQNQTINTINTYMLGAGIKSDIIQSKEDIAKEELKKQVKNQLKNESVDFSMNQKENDNIVKEEYLINENSSSKNYFVVYTTNQDGSTLNPKVPNNFMTKNGFEDNKTPRVCAASSISGCLKALSKNLKGAKLFVHKIISDETPYSPLTVEVPDCKITGEVWFKKPVKLKCIGQIFVSSDDGKDGQEYTYGPDKKVAKLYGWNYNWVEKFNNKESLNENVDSPNINYHIKSTENDNIKKEFAYVPLTEEDLKLGRIKFECTENYNGKYANMTLEGLESFIAINRITKEMVAYTKVPIEELDVMAYDEESEGIIFALPIDIPIYENFKLDIKIEDDFNLYDERTLSQEERDNMDESEYGIPSKKAYPLNDKEHVRKAIQLFNNADEEDKPGLARKIRVAAKKYGIEIDKDSLK